MAVLKEDRQLYTVPEAMELTGLGRSTLYKYLREGKLKGVRMGKVWRISDAALRKFSREGVPWKRKSADGETDTTK